MISLTRTQRIRRSRDRSVLCSCMFGSIALIQVQAWRDLEKALTRAVLRPQSGITPVLNPKMRARTVSAALRTALERNIVDPRLIKKAMKHASIFLQRNDEVCSALVHGIKSADEFAKDLISNVDLFDRPPRDRPVSAPLVRPPSAPSARPISVPLVMPVSANLPDWALSGVAQANSNRPSSTASAVTAREE